MNISETVLVSIKGGDCFQRCGNQMSTAVAMVGTTVVLSVVSLHLNLPIAEK